MNTLALSIRQPWAWLIIRPDLIDPNTRRNAIRLAQIKDIENRKWKTNVRGRVLVHASKTMTEADYWDAQDLASSLGIRKIPIDLPKGGIVGSVEIIDCVQQSNSRWFGGPFGFVLRNPKVLPFRQCKGALGFFKLQLSDDPAHPTAAESDVERAERNRMSEKQRSAELAAAHGSPTDAEILDWLQTHCRMDWPFGNEIQVTARCLTLHAFKDRPTLREAVAAALKSENTQRSRTGDETHGYLPGVEIYKGYAEVNPNNCAVKERTGDGVTVGPCCFYLENGTTCPRHGKVKADNE